jgi:ell wall binding domain 2 (CWB2)
MSPASAGPCSSLGGVARTLVLTLLALALLAGCGGGGGGGSSDNRQPVLGAGGDDKPSGPPLGFPVVATKNTTRVAGADPVADAAAVAHAVFPARTQESKPQALTLADRRDWRSAISAAQLMSRPLRAPVLFSDGDKLPEATKQTLDDLQPTGADKAGGAQAIRVGAAPAPEGLKSVVAAGADPATAAKAIDALQIKASGTPTPAVVVAPSSRPDLAMVAAAWAAKSGEPVLWSDTNALPAPTRDAIRAHKRPKIYVIGPPEAISDSVLGQLNKLGTAKRIGTGDAVTNAIFFARYSDGAFGWNVVDPGHGLVFANTRRTGDAAAAAALSGSGTYGPLLVVTAPGTVPQALQDYLLDIQPGYDKDPVRGVYNHGWLMGDESAISADVQSRIDALLEIQPVDTGGE